MQKLKRQIRSISHTLISLTNSQNFFSRFMHAADFIPEISLPRFANGAGVSMQKAKELYSKIPSLVSKEFTEYWIGVGLDFEIQKNYRAACMSYIMGAFPKEVRPWKDRCNELRRASFLKWCEHVGFDFQPCILNSPYGPLRYYLYIPKTVHAHMPHHPFPVTLFVNGLEGSAEEVAFPLENFKDEGMAFALSSVPGGIDSPIPMSIDSEKLIRCIFDDLEKNPRIDSERFAIVGFSFGAYWSYIATKTDPRIKLAVCNGMPSRHTFNPDVSFSINPVISYGLMCVFNVSHPLFLIKIMRKLTRRAEGLMTKPSASILAMDGDRDTIVDTRDTITLGNAPGNRLLIMKNDDHCGLFHYTRMVQIIFLWLREHMDPHRHRDAIRRNQARPTKTD